MQLQLEDRLVTSNIFNRNDIRDNMVYDDPHLSTEMSEQTKTNDAALRMKKQIIKKQIESIKANQDLPDQIIADRQRDLDSIVTNTNDLIMRQKKYKK